MPTVVVPVDPAQSGRFDAVDGAPGSRRTRSIDEFGPAVAVHGLMPQCYSHRTISKELGAGLGDLGRVVGPVAAGCVCPVGGGGGVDAEQVGEDSRGDTPDLAALPSPVASPSGLSIAICHRDALALTRKGYVDYVEATGEDLVVEAEVEAEVVMSEGDEFIAAMRTQPDDTAGTGLMTLEDAVQAQRAVLRRVTRH